MEYEPKPQHRVKARFDGVVKRYGNTVAVRKLDLDVREGEFLTLLGASGSGKTTSLMMLAGFETPTEGHISLNGNRIDRLPPYKRGMGVVFQNYSLFPHMTIAENIAYPLKTRHVPSAEVSKRVEDALDMVRLAGFGGRRPMQLSGGQQQRVALARALVFKPELVLMDEPLGALDKNLREDMQTEISQIHQRLGATIVYVTHDQSEALTMSNRIAVFDQGEVRQVGSPTEIYERPNCWFVANFVGDNNGLAGKAAEVGEEVATVLLDNGSTVRTKCLPSVGRGDRVVVAVRPERLHLADAGTTADNALAGTMSQVVYFGDHVRAHVDVPGLGILLVKMSHAQALERGSQCRVGWRADESMALPSEANGGAANGRRSGSTQ